MLAQRYRFHGHGSIRYLYRHGSVVRGRWLTLKYSPNPRRRHSRVAVVVSKKILKSAVGRNRIRRRLYELIRHYLDRCDRPYDLVLLVSSADLATLPADQVRAMVEAALAQAGLLARP